MAYSFAEQATRQLMFNNYRQGEDLPLTRRCRRTGCSEVRKPEVAQALLLTDSHLMLENYLEDDQKNTQWKPIRDYWKLIVARQVPEIMADKTIVETGWIPASKCPGLPKAYDETYRMLGASASSMRRRARPAIQMARHVAQHVGRDLFEKWKSGQWSLTQLRQFVDALTNCSTSVTSSMRPLRRGRWICRGSMSGSPN